MATVLISNSNQGSNNPDHQPGDGLLDPAAVAPALSDKSPFRKIEFHLAKKPFTGFANGGGGGGFQLETLNPTSSNYPQKQPGSNQVNGPLPLAGKKRDGLENGLDPEVTFRNTIRRIGAGLENLGNTCFLNSVLQCLTYTEPLAAYLQSGRHQLSCRCAGFCALCAMQKHVSRALQLTGRILAPRDLVSNLRCISRNFRNSRQEDAHEYMVNLLESMHKCCLPSGVPSESPSAYEKSLVHKIFGGRLRSQVKCMQCSFCSDKFDPFLDLSLEIVRADNVSKALANFTAKEQLDGGERQYQCQQCKQKVKALKQLTIYKAPYILTIHLKRFGSHISGQKIDKKIHFAPTLDLKPFVTGPYDEDLKYTLYGVLVHAGWSTHSGHYYCFVRASSGLWYSLDDNKVVQVSERKVFEQKAYMLFYSRDRKSCVSKKPVDVVQNEMIINGITRNSNFSKLNGARDDVRRSVMARTSNGPNSSAAVAQSDASTITTVASKEILMKEATVKEICCSTLCAEPIKEPHLESSSKVPPPDGLVNALSVLHQNVGPALPLSDSSVRRTADSLKRTDAKNVPPVAKIINCGGESRIKKDSSNSIAILSCCNYSETAITVTDKTDKVSMPLCRNGNSSTNKDHIESAAVATNCSVPPSMCIAEKTCSVKVEDFAPKLAGVRTGDDGQRKTVDAVSAELSILPKTMSLSSQEKALDPKPNRKLRKFFLKCQVTSIHLSSNILIGASLSVWKKKKHKRSKKCIKNLCQEHLMDLGPSSSEKVKTGALDGWTHSREKGLKPCSQKGDKTEIGNISERNSSDDMSANSADKEFSERIDKDGAVLATVGKLEKSSSGALRGSLSTDYKGETISKDSKRGQTQNGFMNMLTRGLEETTIARWDEVGSIPTRIMESSGKSVSIGYVADEWDEEYDRGKRKKVRNPLNKFDGQNPFQEIATKKAKLHHRKLDQSSSANRPYRI